MKYFVQITYIHGYLVNVCFDTFHKELIAIPLYIEPLPFKLYSF